MFLFLPLDLQHWFQTAVKAEGVLQEMAFIDKGQGVGCVVHFLASELMSENGVVVLWVQKVSARSF